MAKFYIEVSVKVFINEMVAFYKGDPSLGTREKPYPAEPFCEMIAPFAKFSGPLKNILLFEKDTMYKWILESPSGSPLSFVSGDDASSLVFEMFTNTPSEEKWEEVFVNPPKMDSSGKILIKSKEKKENVYLINTTSFLPDEYKMKYSILFEFLASDGITKYGFIDPLGDPGTKPPPPPPG